MLTLPDRWLWCCPNDWTWWINYKFGFGLDFPSSKSFSLTVWHYPYTLSGSLIRDLIMTVLGITPGNDVDNVLNVFRIILTKQSRRSRCQSVSSLISVSSLQLSTSAQWMRRLEKNDCPLLNLNNILLRNRRTGSRWGQVPPSARCMNSSLCCQTTRTSGGLVSLSLSHLPLTHSNS